MVSISHETNKKVSDFQYNFEHIVLVSKYRFKVFKNQKTQTIVADAFKEVEMQYKIKIREFAFGYDYAHVHMEVNVPNTLSIVQVIQILKSHSASKVFKEMPNYILRYPKKHFWGGQYSNSSVGFANEETIKKYIRRQDVSYQPFVEKAMTVVKRCYSIESGGSDTASLLRREPPVQRVYKGGALIS